MDIVISILEEELRNAKERLKVYKEKFPVLAKSHLYPKKINRNIYYYLRYRDGQKIKSDYIGKLNKDELHKYRLAIEEAKQNREKIKKLKQRIRFIEKSLQYKYIVGQK